MDTLEELKKAQTEQTTEEDQETHPDEKLEEDDQTTDQDNSKDSENEKVDDEEGSQPKKDDLTKGMQKRLAKEKTRQYAIQAELDKERADNVVLQAQVDARKSDVRVEVPVEPKASDYELGADDSGFIAAQKVFDRHSIKHEIVTEIDERNKSSVISQQANERAVQLKDATSGHYERAGKINVEDYLEVEKRAISILGSDVAEAIVMDFEASQDLFYHLGENTEKAQEVSKLFKAGKPVKGLLLLSKIQDEARVKKKPKKFAPDPEGEEEKGKILSKNQLQRGFKGQAFGYR